jgi:hypothetical protein
LTFDLQALVLKEIESYFLKPLRHALAVEKKSPLLSFP